jgi:hypothetical protein
MSRAAPAVRCRTCCPVVMVEDKYRYENLYIRGGFNRHLDFKKIKKHYAGSNFLMAELKNVAKLWNLQRVTKWGT